MKYQRDCMEAIKKLEEQLAVNKVKEESLLNRPNEELAEVKKLLQNETLLRKAAEEEVKNLQNQVVQWKRSEVKTCNYYKSMFSSFLYGCEQYILRVCQVAGNAEILKLRKMLEDEVHRREKLEEEISVLQNQLLQLSFDADEVCDADENVFMNES